jgi:hypothetical protein
MMPTSADDAAWIARYQAATERLKAKESTVRADTSVEEDVRARDTAQRSELVKVASGVIGLSQSEGDGRESRSSTRTLETVKATEAATSAPDAG